MTFHLRLIDGPYRGGTFTDQGRENRPADEYTFHVDGDQGQRTYQATGTYQVDDESPDVVVWHATNDSVELFDWWRKLEANTKAELSADPFGPVSTRVIVELARTAHQAVSAYWPETQTQPDGYYLADDV